MGGAASPIGPWYRGLAKPWFNPPDLAFPVAWTIIYAAVALAGAVAWRAAPRGARRDALVGLFALSGLLNVLWSLLFFTLRRPDWALAEVVGLWASTIVLIVWCARFSRSAAWLLVPYAAWVSFAAYLNFVLVRLNGPF